MNLGALVDIFTRYGRPPQRPRPSYIPRDYNMIGIANDTDQLFELPFGRKTNGIILPRSGELRGDFNALAVHLERTCVMQYETGKPPELDLAEFLAATRSLDGNAKIAADEITKDFTMFAARPDALWSPKLRIVTANAYDANIYGFHTDILLDDDDRKHGRIMCWYNGPATRILRNDRARRVPGTRSKWQATSQDKSNVFAPEQFDILRFSMANDGLIHAADEIVLNAPARLGIVADVMESILRPY